MEFLWLLARQPLFRLLAAVIVLLVMDQNVAAGVGAAIVWVAWVAWSLRVHTMNR